MTHVFGDTRAIFSLNLLKDALAAKLKAGDVLKSRLGSSACKKEKSTLLKLFHLTKQMWMLSRVAIIRLSNLTFVGYQVIASKR